MRQEQTFTELSDYTAKRTSRWRATDMCNLLDKAGTKRLAH